MKVSFDSNIWERMLERSDERFTPILSAIADGRLHGFISEIAFRIEAIRKSDRPAYFREPRMEVQGGFEVRDGRTWLRMSIGPRDEDHPGLPLVMSAKLQTAQELGLKLLRAQAWLELPAPQELRDPRIYAVDVPGREKRQLDACCAIEGRGFGKAIFDQEGGWQAGANGSNAKRFGRACAEWADEELVGAHIGYQNDILCTEDEGRSAGESILNERNRHWLHEAYGVRFMCIDELATAIKK